MNYRKEAIEQRNYIIKIVKEITKRFLFILMIVILYNTFLITKSSLDNNASKEMFGYKSYIIVTESMKPTIKVGDVVLVEKCKEEKLKAEDVITIRTFEGLIITHRIVEININEETGEKEYTTKGDNNTVVDKEIITYKQIEGKKVLVIPLLGKILLALNNKAYIIIILLFAGLIVWHNVKLQKRRKIRREKKRNEDRKQEEEEGNIYINN